MRRPNCKWHLNVVFPLLLLLKKRSSCVHISLLSPLLPRQVSVDSFFLRVAVLLISITQLAFGNMIELVGTALCGAVRRACFNFNRIAGSLWSKFQNPMPACLRVCLPCLCLPA